MAFNKQAKIKHFIGLFVIVILTASIYIYLPEKVKISVENTRSMLYVWEDGKWVLGATEYLYIWDGTKKMRASSRLVTYTQSGDMTIITRTADWKEGIKTVHTYTFNTNTSDVRLIPISSVLECFNCEGKIIHFEYRDIEYSGSTQYVYSPEEYGHNMKIEWQDGAYYSKVFQQKTVPDKLIIRYRATKPYESYEVRMFDPPTVSDTLNMSFNGLFRDVKYELQTTANITVQTNFTPNTTDPYIICFNSSDTYIGDNFTCQTVTNFTGLCYQETANISNGCGGLDTGNYSFNGNVLTAENAFDGDYTTAATNIILNGGIMHVNYTKPLFTARKNSVWQLSTAWGFDNHSIPSSCWDSSPLQFRIEFLGEFDLTNSVLNVYCLNSSGDVIITTGGAGFNGSMFEESMYWDFNGTPEINYSQRNLTTDLFDDNTTIQELTVSNKSSFNIILPFTTVNTIVELSFRMVGNGSTENTSIKVINQTIEFPGVLNGTTSLVNKFRDIQEELVFGTPSTITRFVKYSTHSVVDTTGINLTFNISGKTIDSVAVNFKESFHNSTFIESRVGSAPSYVYDDFSLDEIPGRWITTGDTTLVVVTDVSIGGGAPSAGSGACDFFVRNSVSGTFSNNDTDISDFNEIRFNAISNTVAFCINPNCLQGQIEARASTILGIKDNLGGVLVIETTAAQCSAQTTTRTDSQTIQKDYDVQFRDDGFVWVNNVKKTAYDSTKTYTLYASGSSSGEGDGATGGYSVRFNHINFSGFTMPYNINLTFDSSNISQLISNPVNATANVSRVTLTTVKRNAAFGSETLFVSNDNGTTWESVISGIIHTFSSEGMLLRAQINITSTNNDTPFTIDEYTLIITPSDSENVTIDVGGDGIIDFNFTGVLNESNSPRNVTIDSGTLTAYLASSNCVGLSVCSIPILFTTETPGIINYSNIVARQNTSKLQINITMLNLLDTGTNINQTFNVSSNVSGQVNISNLRLSVLGNGNVTITASLFDSSMSFIKSIARVIIYRHSPFDFGFPFKIVNYDIFPSTFNSKLVQPYGQKNNSPIFTFNTTAKTDDIDITACLNETIDSCLNITWSPFFNMSSSEQIESTVNCNSVINVTDSLNNTANASIYNWWNLSSCNTSAFQFFEYGIIFDSFCSDCLRVD